MGSTITICTKKCLYLPLLEKESKVAVTITILLVKHVIDFQALLLHAVLFRSILHNEGYAASSTTCSARMIIINVYRPVAKFSQNRHGA